MRISDWSSDVCSSDLHRTERQSGVVLWLGEDGAALDRALPFRELIFARQKLRILAELDALDPHDRITPMLAALMGRGVFGEVWVEHADSEHGRPLAGLARSFANALRRPLRSEEHTSELQSLMRISYAVFCL